MRRSPFEKAGLLFLESLPLFGGHATFRVRSKAQSDSPFVNLQEQVLRGTPDKTATIWLSCGLNLASRHRIEEHSAVAENPDVWLETRNILVNLH